MDTNQHTLDVFTQAELALTQAGLTFSVVAACPHPHCEVCTAPALPAAA